MSKLLDSFKEDYSSNLLGEIEEDDEEEENPNKNIMDSSTITVDTLRADNKTLEIAKRFAKDRNGITEELSDEQAIDNFLEHFRSFNVNEYTTGGDWNYVSAASADSTANKQYSVKAKQKLDDYAYLYQKFHALPNFSEGWLGDYVKGLATAPSTLVGLIPMFGQIGKGGAILANQALKQTVKGAVNKAVKKTVSDSIFKKVGRAALPTSIAAAAGRHPFVAASLIEGSAAGFADIARQKTEQKIDVRDELDPTQTAISVATVPAFLGIVGAKKLLATGISKLGKGGDISEKTLADIRNTLIQKNTQANKIASNTLNLPENSLLKGKLSDTLPALDSVKQKGVKKLKGIAEDVGLVDEFALSLDPSRTKRIFAAVTEIISTNKKVRDQFLTNVQDKDGKWKIRITEGIAKILSNKTVAGKTTEDFMSDILEKYNLTGNDISNIFLATFSEAGKTLKQASDFKKLFRSVSDDVTDALGMDLETKDLFLKIKNIGEKGNVREFLKNVEDGRRTGFFRQLDDVRLAAMTSQTGTTFRNSVSGYARIGTDTLVNLFDRALASSVKAITAGTKGKGTVGLFDATPNDDIFSLVFGMTNNLETKAIDEILKLNYNKQMSNLYRELRDIETGLPSSKKGKNAPQLTKARAIGKQLNALNTLSDNYFKRIAFIGSIKKRFNEAYQRELYGEFGLDNLIKLREANKIPVGKTSTLAKGAKFKKTLNYTRKFNDIVKKSNKSDAIKNALISNKTSDEIKNILKDEYNVINMIKNNTFTKYLNSKQGGQLLEDATKDALYFTYQKTPDSPLLKNILIGMHRVPFLTSSFIPFPRFIMNAMRFTYEYSPAYLLSPVNNAFTKTLKSDNYAEVAKGLVGTSFFLGAMAFRESEYAGDKWYLARFPNGKQFDMRPFFPAAPYLYFADIATRLKKGDPIVGESNFIKDSVQALTGTQFRAGLGLYAIDEGISAIFDSDSTTEEKFNKFGKFGVQAAANLINTYTIPLTPIQDVLNTFVSDDDARIVKETRSSNLLDLFINKSLARIPENYKIEKYLSELMGHRVTDVYETPTRSEPLRRFTPLTRQTYGYLLRDEGNFLEKELDRLKLRKNFINQNTGTPEADTLWNEMIGEWSSTYLSPLLEKSETYKLATDEEKKNLIKEEVVKWKSKIKDRVKLVQELEEINTGDSGIRQHKKYGFNPIKKQSLENKYRGTKLMFLSKAKEAYNEQFGAPEDGISYDYDKLKAFAEYFELKFETTKDLKN